MEVRSEGSAWNEDEDGHIEIIVFNPLDDYTFNELKVTLSVTGPAKMKLPRKVGGWGVLSDTLVLRHASFVAAGYASLGPGEEAWLSAVLVLEGAGALALSTSLQAAAAPTPKTPSHSAGRTLLTIEPS